MNSQEKNIKIMTMTLLDAITESILEYKAHLNVSFIRNICLARITKYCKSLILIMGYLYKEKKMNKQILNCTVFSKTEVQIVSYEYCNAYIQTFGRKFYIPVGLFEEHKIHRIYGILTNWCLPEITGIGSSKLEKENIKFIGSNLANLLKLISDSNFNRDYCLFNETLYKSGECSTYAVRNPGSLLHEVFEYENMDATEGLQKVVALVEDGYKIQEEITRQHSENDSEIYLLEELENELLKTETESTKHGEETSLKIVMDDSEIDEEKRMLALEREIIELFRGDNRTQLAKDLDLAKRIRGFELKKNNDN